MSWEELREQLREMRDGGWSDPYWWADHMLLSAILLTVVTGLLEVTFAYLEGRAKRAGLGAAIYA